jgi:hypothetical protein
LLVLVGLAMTAMHAADHLVGRRSPGALQQRSGGSAATAPDPAGGALGRLRLVPERREVPGFDRTCGAGRGCVFGPAWSDDVDIALGHDGCDTRNDILRTQLREVRTKPGTGGCVVLSGELLEPYTGAVVSFRHDRGGAVAIDHVYPLAAAWDLGAATWPAQRRRDFANDPRNLLATSRSVNAAKGDKTPGQWQPVTPEGRCIYAQRYVTVAAAYGLAVTRADRDTLQRLLGQCARPVAGGGQTAP